MTTQALMHPRIHTAPTEYGSPSLQKGGEWEEIRDLYTPSPSRETKSPYAPSFNGAAAAPMPPVPPVPSSFEEERKSSFLSHIGKFAICAAAALASPLITADTAEAAHRATVSTTMIRRRRGGNARSSTSLASKREGRASLVGRHSVRPEVWAKFGQLKALVRQRWPRSITIVTSTTGGRHVSPNHRLGRAIDFVVTGMTRRESLELESMCRRVGFRPYNEYIKSSRFKTGGHMHIEM